MLRFDEIPVESGKRLRVELRDKVGVTDPSEHGAEETPAPEFIERYNDRVFLV